MDKLINEVIELNNTSKIVHDNIQLLSSKLTEVSDAFMNLGQSLVKVIPPTARAEKFISNYLRDLPVKQNKLNVVGKLERSTQIKDEYLIAYREWQESSQKLDRMVSQNNPALRKRIVLQKERVDGFKDTLDGIEAESKLELEYMRDQQREILTQSVIVLLEFQKKVFEQCSGAIHTFQLDWKNGKRYI